MHCSVAAYGDDSSIDLFSNIVEKPLPFDKGFIDNALVADSAYKIDAAGQSKYIDTGRVLVHLNGLQQSAVNVIYFQLAYSQILTEFHVNICRGRVGV